MFSIKDLLIFKDITDQNSNKRANKRYKTIFPVLFCPYPFGNIFTGETLDISEKGTFIRSDNSLDGFKVNDGIWIKFCPDGEFLRMLQYSKVLSGEEPIKDLDSFIGMLDYLKD